MNRYGWDPEWSRTTDLDSWIVGRVVSEDRKGYRIETDAGSVRAILTGRSRREWNEIDYPAVGDWVELAGDSSATILTVNRVLPRRTALVRQAAGRLTRPQVIAANVDTVFCVTSLNRDFNPRRIERYVTAIWDSGAAPVIVLTKADVCDDTEEYLQQLPPSAFGVSTLVVSAVADLGMEQLREYCTSGKTLAFVGSSGAGKSTLINCLMGKEVLKVGEIREDDARGRHTTTRRELLTIPTGGIVIDTPGMREFQLWGDEPAGIESAFPEIEELLGKCRYRDCQHEGDDGCAIEAALESGELSEARLASYKKLMREEAFQKRRRDDAAKRAEQQKWRRITVNMRQRKKSGDWKKG